MNSQSGEAWAVLLKVEGEPPRFSVDGESGNPQIFSRTDADKEMAEWIKKFQQDKIPARVEVIPVVYIVRPKDGQKKWV